MPLAPPHAASRSWCSPRYSNFLPGFFEIPPIDRAQARFAQATKQMIESSDSTDIRSQEDARYKNPVGIHWLQALVKTADLLGVPQPRITIWLYRIPSLVGALFGLLLTIGPRSPLCPVAPRSWPP